ncbi:uncharacterized protein dtwd2 isoform X2 [Myxocyprinus asiaticus]|uniref:uncharacterized protein dtwd2 isoform X2 n=1 Tax=Myxocyprinus asiaticus TaxID=70543 RepID=UPI002221B4E7|nr:uncharacterized protein dtwd2 isoform X2 [Myxocyprinus asiaticus]
MSSAFNEETKVTDDDEEEMKERHDDDDEGFSLLLDLPVEISERRPTCHTCCRPVKVCLCPYLPAHPLDVSTCLYIVQHPAEESRVLRTVPLLTACLPAGKCKVFIGRRFSEERSFCRESGGCDIRFLLDSTQRHSDRWHLESSQRHVPPKQPLQTPETGAARQRPVQSVCDPHAAHQHVCVDAGMCRRDTRHHGEESQHSGGSPQTSSGSVFIPASTRCSDSPQ